MLCNSLCRRRLLKLCRIIRHWGQIRGEVANNSAFLVATHLAVVLYGESEVVNNWVRCALPGCDGLEDRAQLCPTLWAAGFSISNERAGVSRLPDLNQLYTRVRVVSRAPQHIVDAARATYHRLWSRCPLARKADAACPHVKRGDKKQRHRSGTQTERWARPQGR